VLWFASKLRDLAEEFCPTQLVGCCGVLEQVFDSVHLLEEVLQLLSFLASTVDRAVTPFEPVCEIA
jgi:hypothetical protein